MKSSIRTYPLDLLIIDPNRRLSWPAENEDRAKEPAMRFPGLPLIVADKRHRIIWGECRREFLRKSGESSALVLEVNLEPMAALFLGFNLLQTFHKVNLYEKLNFAALALKDADPKYIYRHTGLDISLNQGLIAQLPILLGEDFSRLMREGRIALPAAREAAAMIPESRKPLLELMRKIRFSASQGLRLVSLVREIVARDDCCTQEVLNQAEILAARDHRRAADAVLNSLHKLRYPMTMEAEKAWRRRVEGIRPPQEMQVSHAPFFEPPGVDLRWHLPDLEALRRLVTLLEQAGLPGNESG